MGDSIHFLNMSPNYFTSQNIGICGSFAAATFQEYVTSTSPPPPPPPPPPQAAINQSHMSDDALEELSEAREPRQRDSISIKSTDTDLPKFSSWAAGNQSQLDTDVLTKHVRQMVDVSSPTTQATSHDHPCCHMTTHAVT